MNDNEIKYFPRLILVAIMGGLESNQGTLLRNGVALQISNFHVRNVGPSHEEVRRQMVHSEALSKYI